MLTHQIHFISKDDLHRYAKLIFNNGEWILRFYYLHRTGRTTFDEIIDDDPPFKKNLYIEPDEAINDLEKVEYEETWRGVC